MNDAHPCVGPHFRTIRGRMICQCGCVRCGTGPQDCICVGCQCRRLEDHDDE